MYSFQNYLRPVPYIWFYVDWSINSLVCQRCVKKVYEWVMNFEMEGGGKWPPGSLKIFPKRVSLSDWSFVSFYLRPIDAIKKNPITNMTTSYVDVSRKLALHILRSNPYKIWKNEMPIKYDLNKTFNQNFLQNFSHKMCDRLHLHLFILIIFLFLTRFSIVFTDMTTRIK